MQFVRLYRLPKRPGFFFRNLRADVFDNHRDSP
jgi:hypothetical protein